MSEIKNLVKLRFHIEQDICLSCAACWKLAPENFDSHPVHAYAFVKKQPESEAEALKCREALRTCPVSAIVEDNDEG